MYAVRKFWHKCEHYLMEAAMVVWPWAVRLKCVYDSYPRIWTKGANMNEYRQYLRVFLQFVMDKSLLNFPGYDNLDDADAASSKI